MKAALALLLALPLSLPFFARQRPLTRQDVQRAILAQMNGSSAGSITRQVACRPTGAPARVRSARYECVLTGARGSERASVTVAGRAWRADWAPLRG